MRLGYFRLNVKLKDTLLASKITSFEIGLEAAGAGVGAKAWNQHLARRYPTNSILSTLPIVQGISTKLRLWIRRREVKVQQKAKMSEEKDKSKVHKLSLKGNDVRRSQPPSTQTNTLQAPRN